MTDKVVVFPGCEKPGNDCEDDRVAKILDRLKEDKGISDIVVLTTSADGSKSDIIMSTNNGPLVLWLLQCAAHRILNSATYDDYE